MPAHVAIATRDGQGSDENVDYVTCKPGARRRKVTEALGAHEGTGDAVEPSMKRRDFDDRDME